MRQFQLSEEGGIDGLTIADAPEPTAARGQVVVKMHAASLNYRDLLIVNGYVLTMDGSRTVYPDGAIAISGRKIVAVGPSRVVEAAWQAVRGPGPLRALYERIARRRGNHIAAVAVARKLAVIVWHLLKRGEDYAWVRPALHAKKLRDLELRSGPVSQPSPFVSA